MIRLLRRFKGVLNSSNRPRTRLWSFSQIFLKRYSRNYPKKDFDKHANISKSKHHVGPNILRATPRYAMHADSTRRWKRGATLPSTPFTTFLVLKRKEGLLPYLFCRKEKTGSSLQDYRCYFGELCLRPLFFDCANVSRRESLTKGEN